MKENIAKEICKNNDFEFIEIKYEKGRHIVYYMCNKHKEKGILYKRYERFITSKKNCPYCSGLILDTNDLINHPNIKENIIILGEYKAHNIKVKCQCNIDGRDTKSFKERKRLSCVRKV